MHALKAKTEQSIEIKTYAAKVGRKQQTVLEETWAARVALSVNKNVLVGDHFHTLKVIHAAPSWLWPALVEAMVSGSWTVKQTRTRCSVLIVVRRHRNLPGQPAVRRTPGSAVRGWPCDGTAPAGPAPLAIKRGMRWYSRPPRCYRMDGASAPARNQRCGQFGAGSCANGEPGSRMPATHPPIEIEAKPACCPSHTGTVTSLSASDPYASGSRSGAGHAARTGQSRSTSD
jgi:hypothetical protein